MPETWFYRSQGVTKGPVDLGELRRLAATGELDAEGEVCTATNRTWRRVDSLIELPGGPGIRHRRGDTDRSPRQPGPPVTGDAECIPEQIQSLNELDFEFVSNTEAAAPANSPTETVPPPAVARPEVKRRSSKEEPATRRSQSKCHRWFCLIKGVEYGPYQRVELDSMIRRGRVDARTRVRCGEDSDWIAANQVAGLLEGGMNPSGQSTKPKTASTKSCRSFRLPRAKTLLLQLALLLTIGAVGYGITYRVRDISDDDLYSRSEMILARHYSLKRSKQPPSRRAKLIEDAKSLKREIEPVLQRTAGALRPHRRILLIAIRDHLLQMVRNTTDAELHENAFVDNFRKAKRMWLDPHQHTHAEPTAIEPKKTKTRRRR